MFKGKKYPLQYIDLIENGIHVLHEKQMSNIDTRKQLKCLNHKQKEWIFPDCLSG